LEGADDAVTVELQPSGSIKIAFFRGASVEIAVDEDAVSTAGPQIKATTSEIPVHFVFVSEFGR